MNIYNLILAGGKGTRLWPLSKEKKPKQLINILGNENMINETIARCKQLTHSNNIFIVTNVNHKKLFLKSIPHTFDRRNIFYEPDSCNTAPSILLSSNIIYNNYGDGVLCVFPSDNYIKDEKIFSETITKAVFLANKSNKICFIGVKPTFESTGYGYIKVGDKSICNNEYNLTRFIEKPSYKEAKEFFESKKYLWNSGIFVCKISVLLKYYSDYMPCLYELLMFDSSHSFKKLELIYSKLDNNSIDKGIWESLNDGIVLEEQFGWADIGDWKSIYKILKHDKNKNAVKADFFGIETESCLIYSKKKLITTIGISDIIVVETKDIILICSMDKAQDIKTIVSELNKLNKRNFL